MLKVIIKSLQGQALVNPMTIYVKTRTGINFEKNTLITSFSQSKTEDGNEHMDYIGLPKQAIVEEDPTLPTKISVISAKSDQTVKDYITSLNLPQVVSIDII